jgi:hypothetical protein
VTGARALAGAAASAWLALGARGEIRHRFLCIDNAEPARLLYVDQLAPGNGWARPVSKSSRSLQLAGGGRVLVGLDTGFAEFEVAGGAERRRVGGYAGVSSASRLADGSTWLAAHSPSGVVVHVVGADGLPAGPARLVYPDSSALRVAQVLDDGRLLMAAGKPFRAVEVDGAARVVWSAELGAYGDKGYAVTRLPDGSTLASAGGGVKVVQIDAGGKLLHLWGDEKRGGHPEWRLDFFSGFQRLNNGHVVVANWLGHGKHGKGPHLVEFDEGNALVWQWEDHAAARQVTNVLILE